jgi:2-amino-4-hydroxy-6-hydroxymethyldihydropteridine diphosphokinase
LGSNLGHPEQQISQALMALAQLPESRLLAQSSLYRSSPLGPKDQPDFVNAVAAINTGLSPHALLQQLQRIELAQGRRRDRHWGPRTLDLDLLIYGEIILSDEDLTVPHTGLTQRNFVLYPLYEIAPELVVPGLGALSKLLAGCARGDLVLLHG